MTITAKTVIICFNFPPPTKKAIAAEKIIITRVPRSGWANISPEIIPKTIKKGIIPPRQLSSSPFLASSQAAKYIKKDAYLFYATCTLNKKENERQIEKFLERHENFELVFEKTFDPLLTKGDGFYVAQCRKKW